MMVTPEWYVSNSPSIAALSSPLTLPLTLPPLRHHRHHSLVHAGLLISVQSLTAFSNYSPRVCVRSTRIRAFDPRSLVVLCPHAMMLTTPETPDMTTFSSSSSSETPVSESHVFCLDSRMTPTLRATSRPSGSTLYVYAFDWHRTCGILTR